MAGNVLVDYGVEHLVSVTLEGYCPHACMIIPFGRLDNPMDLFPAQDYRNLELQLTGQASLGAIRVVTQQLRQ